MPRILPVVPILMLATVMFGRAIAADDRSGLVGAGLSESGSVESGSPAKVEFFEKKIRPVLVQRCYKCHSAKAKELKGGLRLDSRGGWQKGGDSGPAVVPGNVEESLLIEAIRYEGLEMPPDGKLPANVIADFVNWVGIGAPDPRDGSQAHGSRPVGFEAGIDWDQAREFWSFQPISDPPVPEVHDKSWPKSTIDHFILARLEERGLRPVGPADKRTLIRRATFDLTGLPPTVEEIEAFLADDSPDAFRRVIDRLLDSPHYGERWARHWLDVARYAEDQAHSFKPRLYPFGYRYRDWVVRAFNDDMRYDEFVKEQIAGDLLDGPGRLERLPALGFFAVGPVYYGDKLKFDQLDDRLDTLSRGFLGLTIACARCHDHKYDPIPSEDYYSLAGVFASTEYTEAPLAPQDVVEAYDRAEQAVQKQQQRIDKLLDDEAKRLKVDKKQVEKRLSDESKKELESLRSELERLKQAVPEKYPVAHSLKEGSVRNLKVLIRGNPKNEGGEAPRRFLRIVAGADAPPFQQGSGRLELAEAIASPDNPLTARVIVNRVWQHHFGRGLVGTPSNFGRLGERPTHPELLDHLASRFIAPAESGASESGAAVSDAAVSGSIPTSPESGPNDRAALGWSIKRLHRAIMLSAAYQLSAEADEQNERVDPQNRLLWRMNRRRLEVEAWRDAMLAVSGNLDTKIGGPPVDLNDANNHRRTLYAKISRHDLAPLLRLFDFPDPNITAGSRSVTTVPLQQLFVLNSPFMLQQAKALAVRIEASADDPAARIERAFLLAFGRRPSEREVEQSLAFLEEKHDTAETDEAKLTRWQQFAQVLLSANEFLYVD